METFHETHHGLCAPALSLPDDGDPAFVVGDFSPHERLSGAEKGEEVLIRRGGAGRGFELSVSRIR